MGLLESGRVLNELQTMWVGVGSVGTWRRRQLRWKDRVGEQLRQYEELRCAEELRRQN